MNDAQRRLQTAVKADASRLSSRIEQDVNRVLWEGDVPSLGKGICGRIYADVLHGNAEVMFPDEHVMTYTERGGREYKAVHHEPLHIWRAAFLDLHAKRNAVEAVPTDTAKTSE